MRLLAVVLWLVAGTGLAHAAAPPLYDSPEGGFAFTPSPGWETKKEAEEPFPTLSGPKDDLRAPYVVIRAVQDKRELFTFADAAMKQTLKDARFQLSKRDAFQTADKQFGVKFIFSFTAPGPLPNTQLAYRQFYYIVQGPPGIIYAFLATIPEVGWEKYQPALDDMVKSYHLRPVVAAPKATPAPVVEKATGTPQPK